MKGGVNKEIYSNFSMPINDKSIVGYVAHHGEQLVIDDAYDLSPDLPFSFNKAYDQKTGYRTASILTTPIVTSQGEVAGVIQLINSKADNGQSVPFPKAARDFLPLFAANASIAIERGIMTRELILRMMRMAELRDPSETGAHVQRVGAYSAEIFHAWALKKGMDTTEIKRRKDLIRVAAMLHDVGKVGISDKILKKPAKLDDEEYRLMRYHTVFGGQLFAHSTSELDAMSGRIAIGHHEKWNGTGYPGALVDVFAPEQPMDRPRQGEEVEIEARICALADVFDALALAAFLQAAVARREDHRGGQEGLGQPFRPRGGGELLGHLRGHHGHPGQVHRGPAARGAPQSAGRGRHEGRRRPGRRARPGPQELTRKRPPAPEQTTGLTKRKRPVSMTRGAFVCVSRRAQSLWPFLFSHHDLSGPTNHQSE